MNEIFIILFSIIIFEVYLPTDKLDIEFHIPLAPGIKQCKFLTPDVEYTTPEVFFIRLIDLLIN